MRETILLRTMALLKERGFAVESFAHSNACFDLVAKRADLTLVLKVFNNIDALREEHAAELRKISTVFNATVLVLGEKSKVFSLSKGVLYERLGLTALSLSTLENLLAEQVEETGQQARKAKGAFYTPREIVDIRRDVGKNRQVLTEQKWAIYSCRHHKKAEPS